MAKTPIEALQELNRLKRLKDAGLPYSDEEKQQAWKDAFEAEERKETIAFKVGDLAVETTLDSTLQEDWCSLWAQIVIISFVSETGSVFTSNGSRYLKNSKGFFDVMGGTCSWGKNLVPLNDEWKQRIQNAGLRFYEKRQEERIASEVKMKECDSLFNEYRNERPTKDRR